MKITKILKFGGSSVGTPKMIKKVGEIIKAAGKKEKIAVVVSAFQGVTDELLKCAKLAAKNDTRGVDELKKLKVRHIKAVKGLVKPLSIRMEALSHVDFIFGVLETFLSGIGKRKKVTPRDLDAVASAGERLSAYIVAVYLYQITGGQAYYLDASMVVKTDNNFTNAAVDFKKTNRRVSAFFKKSGASGKIPIITGFIGSNSRDEVTTLGRGGSDYTAAIFGAALGVKIIEIWTDVDGVMSADPRLVKNARILPQISYEEAIEMAYFGAKVIHPATMLPAIKKGIPILIKNTFNPQVQGTLISGHPMSRNYRNIRTSDVLNIENFFVKAVTSIDDIALVNVSGVSLAGIPGSAARVFEATARAKSNVILISQASSEHTICFAIKSNELPAAFKSLEKEFFKEIKSNQVTLNTIPNQVILAIVGDDMRGVPGISGKLFKSLGDGGINITAIAQGGSERNISFVTNSADKLKALNIAHNEFFENGSKNIFLAGTGNIGGTLLNQISTNPSIKVYGIIDTFHMLMDEKGINLNSWRRKLGKEEKPDLEKWLNWVKSLPLGNKIFVDCTASKDIAKKYIELAEVGFHIVTPNKKFNVFPMKDYKKLREIMAKNQRQFLYETNVGAGLPLISTIRDLLASGDKITKIEGVFSGTLSYIFNNYDGVKSFNKIVEEAKNLGYTEPDPREDLSGQDVGRKLLVLAREIGYAMEFKDVKIENLVPRALLSRVIAPEKFLKRLKESDGYFKKLLEKIYRQKKVLRYVAKLERGKATASLQAVSLNNPLASTRGADNIFAIYTKRYNKRPLVVQGPGAGAEVTAGGVLADILKI
jgi:aspartokinase/homoserine dehydrogenase 1